MNKIFTILILIIAHITQAQTTSVLASLSDAKTVHTTHSNNVDEDKAMLKRFVKNYLNYRADKYIYIGCNDGNKYYNQDTIKMQRIRQDYYPMWECCSFVEWRLVNDAEFLWSDLQTCDKEIQRSYYLSTTKINASQKNRSIYLSIERNGIIVDRFKVLNIEEVPSKHNESNKVLVLLRQSTRF